MKKSLFTLMIFFATASCYAQKLPWFLSRDGSKFPYSPLFVVHTQDKVVKTNDPELFNQLLSPYIDSIKIIPTSAAIKLFGQKANHGAIVFRYHDNINVDSLNRVNLYDMITEMDMGIKTVLPIYVDHLFVKYPKDVYLDRDKIAAVEQRTEKAYHNATYFSVTTIKFVADSIKLDSLKKISFVKKTDTLKRAAK